MKKLQLLAVLCFLLGNAFADTIPKPKKPLVLMDMVHHNPGLAPTESRFLDPAFLKSYGYGAKVFFLFEAAQFGITWQDFDATIFPAATNERNWVDEKKKLISVKYKAAKAEGLNVYCMLDMLVFPKKLVAKYRDQLCNDAGKLDITKPFTQQCVRALMAQMFTDFPELDGIVVRTGETYLQDAPAYVGGTPVVNGMSDHVALLNILRDEVCVKRNKKVFYRTWDISQLHALPQYYLAVSNAVKPHANLYFSIKHTNVDFWRSAIPDGPAINFADYKQYWIDEASKRGVYFNPCIGIGAHQQIVEVQCQREYEGKATQPNYIAKGVIDGFEELSKQKVPFALNHIKNNPLFAGIWTWSRGGGWGGPFAVSEFWPQLNAFVIAAWTKSPDQTEAQIFRQFATMHGLKGKAIEQFHRLCLLSLDGVMEGQYSKMGGVFVNWTRDDQLTGDFYLKPYFDQLIKADQVQAYLNEKRHAVAIWLEIEQLAKGLEFKDPEVSAFVRASCTYARFKFQLFEVAWQIMLKGQAGIKNGKMPLAELSSAISTYDQIFEAWQQFIKNNKYAPSSYAVESDFFGNKIGLKQTVDHYRKLIEK